MKPAAIGLMAELGLTPLSIASLRWARSTLRRSEDLGMDEIDALLRQAASLGSAGAAARKRGDEAAAESHFREGLGLAVEATNRTAGRPPTPARLEILRAAIRLALDCGEAPAARRWIGEALAGDPSAASSEEWERLRDAGSWPDEWLIAAVRREPPDGAALDVLADRYWKPLFGRCQMLTLNQEKASDLAQQAWCRVLRARNTLRPGGNFPAFLTTVATNLWRDSHRSARRAGPLAENRLASLDAALPAEDAETAVLADLVPDLNALRAEEQRLLALDIDQALEQLTPLLRDVVVSRLIDGESCAEIGRRFHRTEQTISAWVRQAIREMRRHLEGLDRVVVGGNQS